MSTRNIIQALQGAAGAAAGGAVLDVDDVFSTHLYAGDGNNAREINNGIDLSGEGGMVWFKARTTAQNHRIFDTERGSDYSLITNSTAAQANHGTGGLNSFDDDGFTLGNAVVNGSGIYGGDYTSWTWRKQAKFFDIVEYEGNSQTSQTISHSLGSKPGMMIVKRTDGSGIWWVYHRHLGATKMLKLQSYEAHGTYSGVWNDTEPTSTEFTVGSDSEINYSNRNYIAYLFAHNDGDGTFGPSGDQDIIKCGSYTVPSTSVFDVDLGFEPQFVLIKATGEGGSLNQYYDWFMFDSMRGLNTDNVSTGLLVANETTSEANNPYHNGSYDLIQPTSTGFKVTGAPSGAAATASNGYTYAYMAIRRGPLAEPTAVDDVFDVDTVQASSGNQPAFKFNFVTDFIISRQVTATQDWLTNARLVGQKQLKLNTTDAQTTNSAYNWDYMDGAWDPFSASPVFSAWGWKRAPSFCDILTYSGNGTEPDTRSLSHNLGVTPEMCWIKARTTTEKWMVWHKDLTQFTSGGKTYGNSLTLNDSTAVDGTGIINVSDTNATTLKLGFRNNNNTSGQDYIAVLFSSLAGISAVGSYTGNGTSQTIDCGFSNGARLVLVKQSSGTGSWFLFDYARGINSGNDSLLQLNASGGEYTGADYIDPHSSGFIAVGDNNNMNTNGQTFIFYAIAA